MIPKQCFQLLPHCRVILALALFLSLADSVAVQSTCPTAKNDTLYKLSSAGVSMIAAGNSTDCCTKCVLPCQTWSFQNIWTPETPCHLSPFAPIGTSTAHGCSGGSVPHAPPAPGPPAPSNSTAGTYVVDVSPRGVRQKIWGIGFEIQSDSIGSGNNGMPKDGTLVPDDDNSTSSAPHDLTNDERIRFATSLLPGFRWCRLALGLFLRGLSSDNKQIEGRWPSQMAELKQMQDLSGIEGFAPEYWSPPPGWKDSKSYYGGTLASFAENDLGEFGNALINDVKYLRAQGLKVPWWGLQNEPTFASENISADACTNQSSASDVHSLAERDGKDNSYSKCSYSQCSYYKAFAKIAPMIKSAFPGIKIHANSARGQKGASPIASDAAARANVDLWTVHYVGGGSDVPLAPDFTDGTYGIPIINNEFEYQPGQAIFGTPQSTLNTAQLIMNFFTFAQSPGFYWIHALKPTTNKESAGYSLGYWRPPQDTNMTRFPDLAPRHWVYNPINYHAVAGFAKHMPWESTRLYVVESEVNRDARIVAFRTPATTLSRGDGGPLHAFKTPPGRLGIILAYGQHALPSSNYTYGISINDGQSHVLNGYRYTPDASGYNVSIGTVTVPAQGTINITLQALTIEFWLEY
eukprot:m.238549 g.238549  ORF g.238549 m.238549 type:complete len:634 (-) comp19390_c0_seq7:142-2043(-)